MRIMELVQPKTATGNDAGDHIESDEYADHAQRTLSAALQNHGGQLLTVEALTEDACALEWSRRHPHWRYTAAFNHWHEFDDQAALWVHDNRLKHMTLARELVREIAPEKLHKAASVAGVVSLARSNQGVSMTADQWDADPWLLGTPGSVIDLRNGEPVSDPMPCYITRQTAVALAPKGTPIPIWFAFLARITRHDPELIPYLQRIAGYALTGSDREQCLFFPYGPGGNGKGVFMNTVTSIIGDYAHVGSGDLLLAANGERHPTDMASLRGRRFVTASELRPGARWDEQRLKSLTGGDPVTARFMRQDEFTFRPQFTLMVAGNHRPSFSGVDEAIRRRLRLIPFTQVIPDADRDLSLPEKLRAEWSGILRWMVEGCIDWQREGLPTPQSVIEASAAYLEAEDSLGQWITDRLHQHDPRMMVMTPRKVLFDDWLWWADINGGPKWTAKSFYLALEERGYTQTARRGDRGFKYIALVSPTPHWGSK